MTDRALHHESVIFLAGHRGLVGSALGRCLKRRGYTNIITRTRAELDLRDQRAVDAFFASERPSLVLLAAVGWEEFWGNNTYPADFIHDNIIVQDNVIHSGLAATVGKRCSF